MENHQPDLDTIFHALADSTRRAVVQQLAVKEASISELASPHDMALPSFMKHIRVLEASGLIASIKHGRVRTCSIEPKRFAVMETWLNEQRRLWEGRTNRLAEFVEALPTGKATE